MLYIKKLINNCNAALKANPIRQFTVSELDELIGINKAIYVIELVDGDPEEVFLQMSKYKSKGERKCPKLNSPSNVLYVGSSTKSLKNRIKQHMGDGHKDTYALHLNYWLINDYKISISQYDVSNEVLQIIEDSISYELSPAFGKMGSNNK